MDARLRTVVLAPAAALVLACDAPTAAREEAAYDPVAPSVGRNYHWPLGRTVGVYVDPTAEPSGTDLEEAVREGAARWNAAVYYREFTLRVVSTPDDADVVVHHATAPLLVGTGTCDYPPVAAGGVTFFCPAVSGDTVETLPLLAGAGPGRLKIDVRVDRARVADDAGFRSLVAHELGHVVGIGAHSDRAEDLMFAVPRAAAPSARDERTLRFLLHEPAGYTL